MDIIAGIGAATEGLKLINELRKIDREVDKADLKLRLVEVADKLLDSKQALQEAQEREFKLAQAIAKLEAKLADRGRFMDKEGLLFELNPDGNTEGEPFCNQCFVKEGLLFRLLLGPYMPGAYKCSNCQGFYGNSPKFDAY
jgi:hypothetical protein